MTIRWRNKNEIGALTDADRMPISDEADGGTDKYWTPPKIITYLAGKALALLRVGIGGAAADATNRLSVNSPAVLFNREVDDVQVKVNKEAAGDTASFLFQTGFSGRAEIGLVGDDDFQFKVSPDGSSFFTGILIDKDTGLVSFPVNDAVAWVAFTPAVTPTSGTFTSAAATGAFHAIGKTVYFRMDITITTVGTGSGALQATLPVASRGSGVVVGRKDSGTLVAGSMMQGLLAASSATLTIRTYNQVAFMDDGTIIRISGTYEAA